MNIQIANLWKYLELMATNKNAILRYNTLDRCFSNVGRRYSFKELMEAVNDALREENTETNGVKVRQIRDDIRFMKSEVGFSAPIEVYTDAPKPYYRYSDHSYSIKKQPLNINEAELMNNVLPLLQRFEGTPGFEWIAEISPMLSNRFGLKNNMSSVMSYESNIDYSGYAYISPIFRAIIQKKVLKIIYQPFGREEEKIILHPHYLKQTNNRWFVLGLNEDNGIATWNLALDRIKDINEINAHYQESEVDWDSHFYDIVGVTRLDQEVEEVKLWCSASQAPYIETKPLHPSQKFKYLEDGSAEVRIKVVQNYELKKLLLSFGDSVQVLEPNGLSLEIQGIIRNTISNYEKAPK